MLKLSVRKGRNEKCLEDVKDIFAFFDNIFVRENTLPNFQIFYFW